MHAVHCGYGKFFEQALLNHHSAAGLVFFGRLEDKAHGAPKLPRLGQVAGGTEQHRSVPVVAAGVHLAGPRRAMREVVGFGKRQRVHVGAQADRGTLADAQRADDTGAGEAAVHVDAEAGQALGDEHRGLVLLERRLRMRMQMLPPRRHLRLQASQLFDRRHRSSLHAGSIPL
jgi:hypothetical protein